MARLKVFVTSDGLTDYVVAVSSKAKALAAWGSHQDLFKTGAAHETDDAELVKTAMARPGDVLRRPAGTREALAKAGPARVRKAPGPSKAALRKIADLEARIAALDAAHEEARRRLEDRRTRLDRDIAALDGKFAAERGRAEAALSAARPARG